MRMDVFLFWAFFFIGVGGDKASEFTIGDRNEMIGGGNWCLTRIRVHVPLHLRRHRLLLTKANNLMKYQTIWDLYGYDQQNAEKRS